MFINSPLFGDINIKYIYGVVESENRLYVLLDIARIFSNKPKSEKESVDSAPKLTVSKLPQTTSEVQSPQVIKRQEIPTVREPVQSQEQVVQEESEVPTVSSIIGQDLQQDNPLDFSQERQDFSLEQNSQASLVDFDFIVDELKSLKKFYVTD